MSKYLSDQLIMLLKYLPSSYGSSISPRTTLLHKNMNENFVEVDVSVTGFWYGCLCLICSSSLTQANQPSPHSHLHTITVAWGCHATRSNVFLNSRTYIMILGENIEQNSLLISLKLCPPYSFHRTITLDNLKHTNQSVMKSIPTFRDRLEKNLIPSRTGSNPYESVR